MGRFSIPEPMSGPWRVRTAAGHFVSGEPFAGIHIVPMSTTLVQAENSGFSRVFLHVSGAPRGLGLPRKDPFSLTPVSPSGGRKGGQNTCWERSDRRMFQRTANAPQCDRGVSGEPAGLDGRPNPGAWRPR